MMPEASDIGSQPFLWLVCYVGMCIHDAVRYRTLVSLHLFDSCLAHTPLMQICNPHLLDIRSQLFSSFARFHHKRLTQYTFFCYFLHVQPVGGINLTNLEGCTLSNRARSVRYIKKHGSLPGRQYLIRPLQGDCSELKIEN